VAYHLLHSTEFPGTFTVIVSTVLQLSQPVIDACSGNLYDIHSVSILGR
jgi:hypothetical protein